MSKLGIPQKPASPGYWDGTIWKTYNGKKSSEWTGVGNPNKQLTNPNQTTHQNTSTWSGTVWNKLIPPPVLGFE